MHVGKAIAVGVADGGVNIYDYRDGSLISSIPLAGSGSTHCLKWTDIHLATPNYSSILGTNVRTIDRTSMNRQRAFGKWIEFTLDDLARIFLDIEHPKFDPQSTPNAFTYPSNKCPAANDGASNVQQELLGRRRSRRFQVRAHSRRRLQCIR
jgi:hypothetical protein